LRIGWAVGSTTPTACWRWLPSAASSNFDALRRRLAGEAVRYDPPVDAVRRTDQFLESLSLETFDLRTIEPRLVRLCHALDHLARLHEDLQQLPPVDPGWQAPDGFRAAAQALAAWLDATGDPAATPDAVISAMLLDASRRVGAERRVNRDALLEEVAGQRVPAAAARAIIEALAWADAAMHHAWRLAESLKLSAEGGSAAAARGDR
jgi:phosphate:Na+ symporter